MCLVWLMAAVFLNGGAQALTLEEVARDAARITSIEAQFVQEKVMPILAAPLESTGRFYFQAPDCLRLEYETPVRSLLLLNRGEASRYMEKDGAMVPDASMGAAGIQTVMTEISGWMAGRFDGGGFDVTLIDESGRVSVVLTPKEKGLAAYIRDIHLVLSETPGVFRQVTVYESGESFTRLTFNGVIPDGPMDQAVFAGP